MLIWKEWKQAEYLVISQITIQETEDGMQEQTKEWGKNRRMELSDELRKTFKK